MDSFRGKPKARVQPLPAKIENILKTLQIPWSSSVIVSKLMNKIKESEIPSHVFNNTSCFFLVFLYLIKMMPIKRQDYIQAEGTQHVFLFFIDAFWVIHERIRR